MNRPAASALSRASSSFAATARPRFVRSYKIAPQAKFSAEEQAALASASKGRRHDLKKGKALAQMTYFVLGHSPENATIWDKSLLAQIMVTPAKLQATALAPTIYDPHISVADIPPELAYGIGFEPKEQTLLFKSLPAVALRHGWTQRTIDSHRRQGQNTENRKEDSAPEQSHLEALQITRVQQLAKIVDLRNASAREIRAENTRRCVRAFSAPDQPNDTGRSEVQAAILTVRIRALWDIMTERGFTGETRRAIRQLCYDRKRILKFLKGLDRDRFDILLAQIGVEQMAIEGELMV